MLNKIVIKHIQETLLQWYSINGRHDLPWRNLAQLDIDVPYGVMVSEFMLQQTQVDRVIPKYLAFLQHFPTLDKLANASAAEVIRLWSGLGYNRRAIMLHQAAGEIVVQHYGLLPADLDELQTLPGIGPYTASAILSFGYNQRVVVMDTNIERFYELLFFGYDAPTKDELSLFAGELVPKNKSCLWHSALMDLMSQVRLIRSPKMQQESLIYILKLIPPWKLPLLTDQPLIRPKQSTFHNSKRYFRGRIIAYLSEQPAHQATKSEIVNVLSSYKIPSEYSTEELLTQLKKDGLIAFNEPINSNRMISLP
jgi:A/G-specific adenine glycosylase